MLSACTAPRLQPHTAPAGPALVVSNLCKRYDDTLAVQDLTFSVDSGSFLTLLGASGSGKSTVLRMIGGFTRPDAGRIHIGGLDVTDMAAYRRNIGVVFQRYALFPHLSVADNVAYPLKMRQVERSRRATLVAEMLENVGLQALAGRMPWQLSGGQQQRVALARALVFKPRILLMDEPLAALDRRLREQMQLEIRTLQRRLRITTVYVTHDQQEAFALSDQVALINEGRIEQIGTPRQLYDRPSSEFVARFVGDSNLLQGHRSPVGTHGLSLSDGSHIQCPLPPAAVQTVVIRPERLQVHAQRPALSAHNLLPGRIEDALFLGSAMEYLVRCGPHLLIARGAPPEPAPPFDSGQPVWVSWRIDDTMMLP